MRTTETAGLDACANQPQSTHCVYGLQFKLMATFPNTDDGCRAANDFMGCNPGASVLANTDAVCIAHEDDMGEPVAQAN